MPFVVIEGERHALPIGETVIGGDGPDALPVPALAAVAPLAIVTILPDDSATIRSVGGDAARLDGRALGPTPVPLVHGAKLDAGGIVLSFGDIRVAGTTSHVMSVPDSALGVLAAVVPNEPTSDRGGRLVLPDGHAVAIPEQGLAVGREPSCDLVLAEKGVSRRHFTIRPSLQGYLLSDTSSNGTLVNERRVDGAQVLGFGDIIRVGDVELRFEAERASFEPPPGARRDERVPASAPSPRLPAAPKPQLLATLEVINEGVMKGTRFRIERPVAHVGRAEHNDVRLDTKSVSAAHATLTRLGTGWSVRDLDSTNGTYVNGERIRGEHRLAGVAELRFGPIKVVFRPIAAGGSEEDSTRAIVGVHDGGEE